MITSPKVSLRTLLRADLSRICKPSFCAGLQQYFLPRGGTFPYVFWFRVVQKLRQNVFTRFTLAILFYPIFRHYEFKYGIHANPNIEIGGGLCVVHGGNVHLNCRSVGKNLTVYQGVTLGIKDGGIPVVEDDVTIYPNSIVAGALTLHNGCVVGALSYVSHDVARGSVVVGAPANELGSASMGV